MDIIVPYVDGTLQFGGHYYNVTSPIFTTYDLVIRT